MPDVSSIFGTSPLHYAVWIHEDPANHMQPLVEQGANVNLQNRKGKPPLHYALSKDWVKPVAFLLNHGAQIETADEDGVTPLAEAVKMDLPNVTNLLINRGANILVRDKKDNSILHVAAANASLKTFASLAQHDLSDLSFDSLNAAGETASSLVRSRHDKTEDLVATFDALFNAIPTRQVQLDEESELFKRVSKRKQLKSLVKTMARRIEMRIGCNRDRTGGKGYKEYRKIKRQPMRETTINPRSSLS